MTDRNNAEKCFITYKIEFKFIFLHCHYIVLFIIEKSEYFFHSKGSGSIGLFQN